MIVKTTGSMLRIIAWQWKFVLMATGCAASVAFAHRVLKVSWVEMPSLPLAVVGAALGIFVSFRTNSSYDRWWEGRKLWGRLINTSRHLAVEVCRYLPAERSEDRRRIVRRHITYVHVLRCLLRREDPLTDRNLEPYLSDKDREMITGSSNQTLRLLDQQMQEFCALNAEGIVDDFRLQALDESVRHLLDIQGGCERIKKTPLPMIYGLIAERMILWFSCLLPCALVSSMGWATIPVCILVALGFKLISETGRVLEDPFTTFYNGLPLSAMSRTIERNLLELLGEKELPEPVQIRNGFLLM